MTVFIVKITILSSILFGTMLYMPNIENMGVAWGRGYQFGDNKTMRVMQVVTMQAV